jgi:hypothetical protein
VEVLASYDGNATLVQSRNILAATFHPELSDDATVHRHFLSMIARPVWKDAEPDLSILRQAKFEYARLL